MKKNLETLELRISLFLRYGVLIAGGLMLIGWLANLQLSGNPLAAFHEYAPMRLPDALSLAVWSGAWGKLLSYVGLFVLISLPVLRVLMTGVLFVLQGERRLAAVAFIVLAVLALSFALGFEV
jgi:uncharacterized membrane protein